MSAWERGKIRGMSADDRRKLDAVAEAIQTVAGQFRREPASFLFEADLQAVVFTRLFDLLAASKVSWQVGQLGLSGFKDREVILNPVKSEYLYEHSSGQRFDVAVLSPKPRSERKVWNQDVRIGIEIKLWQADCRTGDNFVKDRKKLERYQEAARSEERLFTGLCVTFCHVETDERVTKWGDGATRLDGTQRPELPANGVEAFLVVP